MRSNARATLAIVVALALHLVICALIATSAVRPVSVATDKARRAVEVALWSALPPPAPPSSSPPAPPPPPVDEPPPPEMVDPPAPAPAPPALAPPTPPRPMAAASAAPTARPRTLLERVLAGTSAGPAPSLDVLDPSRRAPPPTDGERARRAIQALASAAAARGAPPTDAGTLVEALEPLEDGGYRYVTGGFEATIHVDGSVSFADRTERAGAFTSGLPGRDPGNVWEPYGPTMKLLERIDGAPAPRVAGIPVVDEAATLGSASFDPTAALVRAAGQDPYAPEKACFLEETRPLRADLRAAYERAQVASLRLHLERLWFDDARPAVERRAALFAAWDECREEELGALARELIVSFIRQHLPRGGGAAYTPDELRALNARRTSTAPFAPYG